MTIDSTAPLLIGACANLKPSCEMCSYWNSGAILKVGPVTVRISRDNTTLDVIGRCKITDGSKQALIMTWVVLAKYFYVNEALLMNYKGICPEVIRTASLPRFLIKEINASINTVTGVERLRETANVTLPFHVSRKIA